MIATQLNLRGFVKIRYLKASPQQNFSIRIHVISMEIKAKG
jgi:hypothetical protein